VAEISIALESRTGTGKSYNRKLRANGRAPGVVYGAGREAVAISFDPKVLQSKIKESHAGINTLFDLTGDASVANRVVMVKELQREPVRGAVLHADFFEIDMTERLHISVPVHLSGSAPGLLEGGVIEHALRELELMCLPDAIPDEVVADVSGLGLGQSLHVADIELPPGVELISDGELSVVSVLMPKAVEEEVAVPEEGEEGEEGAESADGEAGSEGSESESEAKAKGAGDKDSSG
jgi:large subunit ribosomal protein L25